MTRGEYLDRVVQSLRRPEHGSIHMEFKPFTGWLLVGETRSLADDGCDFAGANWRDAERFLRWFLGGDS